MTRTLEEGLWFNEGSGMIYLCLSILITFGQNYMSELDQKAFK